VTLSGLICPSPERQYHPYRSRAFRPEFIPPESAVAASCTDIHSTNGSEAVSVVERNRQI
jgi:hypothetical protein